jgi:cbb3-type cytochrome oxidase subunit 3
MSIFSFDTLSGMAVFFLGVMIGSFLNVVVYRYRTGAKIVNDR